MPLTRCYTWESDVRSMQIVPQHQFNFTSFTVPIFIPSPLLISLFHFLEQFLIFFFCIQLNYFLLYVLNSIYHFSYFSRFQFFFYSGCTKIFQNLLMKINICKNVQVRRIDFLFRYFYSQFRVEIKLEEYLIFFYSNC